MDSIKAVDSYMYTPRLSGLRPRFRLIRPSSVSEVHVHVHDLLSEHQADSAYVQVLEPQCTCALFTCPRKDTQRVTWSRVSLPGEGGRARAARAVTKSTRQSQRSPRCSESMIDPIERWCCGAAFFPRLSKCKSAHSRTDRLSCTFLMVRTSHRPFFESGLEIKCVPPNVFRIPAPYERGTPVHVHVFHT